MLLTLMLSLLAFLDEGESDDLGNQTTDLNANSEAWVGSDEKIMKRRKKLK